MHESYQNGGIGWLVDMGFEMDAAGAGSNTYQNKEIPLSVPTAMAKPQHAQGQAEPAGRSFEPLNVNKQLSNGASSYSFPESPGNYHVI